MRAWQIESEFGLDNLRLVEREVQPPSVGEVRIRLEAVSLNSRDNRMIEGIYNPRQSLPLVPCSDGVGMVEAVGPGVDEELIGRRVCTTLAPHWVSGEPRREVIRTTLGGPLDGTLQEQMCLPAQGVVDCPAYLDPLEGATLGCAGLTAWNAVRTVGAIGAGQTVLVLGTGGVSIFALQIANLLGARAIVTSSSDRKLELAQELGAWQTINYREVPEWGREVQAMTSGEGADLVVEVGGATTLPQSIRSARIGGTIAMIGVVGAAEGPVNVVPIFMRELTLQGILVGHRESFEAMNRALEQHHLRPVIDRVLPFEQAPEALRYFASASHFGKVCIEF